MKSIGSSAACAAEIPPPDGSMFDLERHRWEALRRRDPAADGHFFYSVRTTGVYCYPSCAARTARAENVAFHESREAAELAGFRPFPALQALPPGSTDAPGAVCQRRLKFPRKCRSKNPQFGRSGGAGGGLCVFRWPPAATRCGVKGWGRDGGFGAEVFRHQFGMLTQAVA